MDSPGPGKNYQEVDSLGGGLMWSDQPGQEPLGAAQITTLPEAAAKAPMWLVTWVCQWGMPLLAQSTFLCTPMPL